MFRLPGLPYLDSPWPCKWTLARSFGTGSQTFPLHRHHLIFGACYVGNRLTQLDLTTGQSPLVDCIALSFLQISPSHHFPTHMSRIRMNPTVIFCLPREAGSGRDVSPDSGQPQSAPSVLLPPCFESRIRIYYCMLCSLRHTNHVYAVSKPNYAWRGW
jgi:hypothetical protein